MNRLLTLTALTGLVSGLALAMLDATLKGTLLLLVAAMAVALLRRQSAAFRHLVWTGTLGLMLAIPLLSTLLPGWSVLPGWLGVRAGERPGSTESEASRVEPAPMVAREANELSVETSGVEPQPMVIRETAARPEDFEERVRHPRPVESVARHESVPVPVAGESAPSRLRSSEFLFGLWLAGVLLLVTRLLTSLWKLRRHCRQAELIETGPLFDVFEVCRKELSVPGRVRLLSTVGCMPMAWGVLRPCVVIPQSAAEWSESQLRTVLLHELGHVARRDPLWQLISQLAIAVYWFHPGVWLAAWRVQVERERACDDLVLNRGVRAADYARHLLDVVSEGRLRRMGMALGVAMSPQKNLEGRVRSILEPNRNRNCVSQSMLIAGAAVGILSVVPLAMLRAEVDSGEPAVDRSVPAEDEKAPVEPERSTADETPQKPTTESTADESGSEDGNAADKPVDGAGEAAEPVKLFGFDLTRHAFKGDLKSLNAEGGPLNRSPAVADGGYWRSRLQRDKWLLCYSPAKKHFYLQRRKPNSTYYGPISGDALKLLNLVEEIAGSINRDRKADKPNPDGLGTLQNLLKSREPSLVAGGLRILAQVETIEVYEERHFRQWVEATRSVLPKTPEATALYENSIAVMQRHKDRLEKLKMDLPADQYKPSRAATKAELEAAWGEEVDGLRMTLILGGGANSELTNGKIEEALLLLRNVSKKPIRLSTIDGNDSVTISVVDEATKTEQQVRFPLHFFSRSISRFIIAPGELGVVKQPRFWITQKGTAKPKNSQQHSFAARIDVTPGAKYRMTVRLSLPGVFSKDGEGRISVPARGEFYNDLTSGSIPFAVATPKKDEARDAGGAGTEAERTPAERKDSPPRRGAQVQRDGLKVSLLGFDLTPHRFKGDWPALFKPGAPLDREVSIANGGRWSYAVPNRTWYVYYSPIRKVSYVRLRDGEEEYFGPIQGDGMKLFRLEEFLSSAANAQDGQQRRVNSQEVRAIERLISSEEPSLVASGFRALLRVKRLTVNEEPRVGEAVDQALKAVAGEDQLASLSKSVASDIAKKRADIEQSKVLLPDSDYLSGRAPTKEELAAGWGPDVEGLSLAVFPWDGLLPNMKFGDRVEADLLVRNVSQQPKKISTLAHALDGVSAVVTDEKTKHSALLSFTLFTGFYPAQRFLLQPGQVVRIKRPHFSVVEGDLHPPGRKFNPKSRQFMRNRVLVRSGRTYKVEFQLNMPSATSHREGRITLPARGEFDGRLDAPPLRFKAE